ncbi:hypothetical protein L6452_15032 [Arctium lappa]|uniref:Uncharacterized protein n=1 Tax=Arctium lappa TaxID=4217 RepID=A0ACB9CMS0_ARCLA|nr:hypothetical protein L6452_15032 [Arctium lappa]
MQSSDRDGRGTIEQLEKICEPPLSGSGGLRRRWGFNDGIDSGLAWWVGYWFFKIWSVSSRQASGKWAWDKPFGSSHGNPMDGRVGNKLGNNRLERAMEEKWEEIGLEVFGKMKIC